MICGDCLQDTNDLWVDDKCAESVDGMHHPARCLDESEHCSGPIELWYMAGTSGPSWPCCTFHGQARQYRREDAY